jgi:hypothetical protein
MNDLAAAALAAGELICEFTDGYRRSLLAELAGEAQRTETLLVYESVKSHSAEVLSSRKPGRAPVVVREGPRYVHFIQDEGPSVHVTTLTACTRVTSQNGDERCTRFAARHAWHFDRSAHLDPDGSFGRQPSGAATGLCEPWRVG